MSDLLRGFEPAPQDLVLSLLGAHHVPRERGEVWSGGLVRLLEEFGFSAGAARVALNRLVGRGLLDRSKDGRHVHYALTPRTVAVLAEGDRRIFTLGGSPRTETTWTVLWHSIPEDRRLARTRLVRRLRFLGFGSVQDGTWLAPHDREADVAALLAELDVTAHAGVLLGRPAPAIDFATFVARVWDLDDLAARYRAFVEHFRGHEAADDRQALLLRTRLVHTFREFPFLDPELPEDLVPAPKHRAEALRLFHDMYPTLAPAAQRYFDEVTMP
ncbi:MAG: PaaX family transcriptional regulator [Actinophytocola sp.]|uniref:PaaX family transcriptional regulator n=1 Tax=Actinophytocola sp. TaxID=1872138 RepID=UPI001321E1FA|nr:PaaX family transcriptional regulator C-terminal domain-containing protein [Actinophytocola sp.]MPZ84614.1 PaaX family transcriptional regulator [Actinophytocola sp.]